MTSPTTSSSTSVPSCRSATDQTARTVHCVTNVGVGKRVAITVALAVMLGFAAPFPLAAVPASASAPGSTASVGAPVPCDRAAERITLTASADLDPSCTYTGGFDITASNVVLDCHGALIQGAVGTRALGIVVATPADVDLTDVVIRNCRIDRFFNNVHLRRDGFRALAAGHEYDHQLSRVTIEDSTLTNSTGVGLYVDDYVTGTMMRRLLIMGSGSTGIYLDSGSRFNTAVHNIVAGNGFRESGPDGTVSSFSGVTFRYWGPGREGIAIDGSRNNRIAGNWVVGNSYGGVFVYTNCGENVHQNPQSWVEHRYGADDNIISGNLITGGEDGVWIASRMGENVYPMDCSDPPYVSGPIQAITVDRAANNVVRGNTFDSVTYGVRVEDDGATVSRNHFAGSDASHHAVIVGTPFRTTVLGHPVTNTIVERNRSTIVGNPNPYRWVDGIAGLTDLGNRALDHRSRFCQAPTLPRNPLIFVFAFAVQDPAGPPVPKPDFSVPSLGALAPCAR